MGALLERWFQHPGARRFRAFTSHSCLNLRDSQCFASAQHQSETRGIILWPKSHRSRPRRITVGWLWRFLFSNELFFSHRKWVHNFRQDKRLVVCCVQPQRQVIDHLSFFRAQLLGHGDLDVSRGTGHGWAVGPTITSLSLRQIGGGPRDCSTKSLRGRPVSGEEALSIISGLCVRFCWRNEVSMVCMVNDEHTHYTGSHGSLRTLGVRLRSPVVQKWRPISSTLPQILASQLRTITGPQGIANGWDWRAANWSRRLHSLWRVEWNLIGQLIDMMLEVKSIFLCERDTITLLMNG